MKKMEGTSLDLRQTNVDKLKELFPNVITDGKIDFEQLRLILGDDVEARTERYQFTWNGKSDTIRLAQTPSTGTLRPSKEDSKNWDTTENLYIEGDNLEVLKLLQKSYYGKIKMIYIDPPYNTGNDFVYKDDFKDNISNYKKITGQKLKAKTETDGRYHTDWLNMMFSRLMLAKNLLSDDGAIFISIDENEHSNLKKICDEIFGENNLINVFCWLNNLKGRQISKKGAAKTYEFILSYAKNIENINESYIKIKKAKEIMPSSYLGFDYDTLFDEFGDYVIKNELYNTNSAFNEETRPNLVYIIHYNPNTKEIKITDIKDNVFFENFIPIYPNKNNNGIHEYHAWRWSREKVINDKDNLLFLENKNKYKIYTKIRDYNDTILKDIITNIGNGNKELEKLIGKNMFDFPKSVTLLTVLMSNLNEQDIILDFFSGSSTTAHAVMQLNAEDGGNRKFIMVQLPELTDEKSEAYKAGYKNICEIGKERIRRAGEQIKQELIEKNKKLNEDDEVLNPDELDIGFKVYKLDSSNIIPWDGSKVLTEDNLFERLEVIKQERSKLDVLYEIMLKFGVFNMPVEEIDINGKTIYSVAMGHLIVCLEDYVSIDDVIKIGELKPNSVIFKESGFKDDNDKINATYTLERLGIEIKSI